MSSQSYNSPSEKVTCDFGQYSITDPSGTLISGAANITVSVSDDVYIPLYTENRIPKGGEDDFGGHNQPPRWPENKETESVLKDGIEMKVPIVYDDNGNNVTIVAVDAAIKWQKSKIVGESRPWNEIIYEFIANTEKYKGREYIGCVTREAREGGEDLLDCGKRCTKEEIRVDFPNLITLGYCGRPRKGKISRTTALFATFLGEGTALDKELKSNHNSPKSMGFDKIGISIEYYETRKVGMMSARRALEELDKYEKENIGRDLSRWGQKEMTKMCLYLLKEKKIITQQHWDNIFN